MRAESPVEPTKSENITVTWRRSAMSILAAAGGAEAAALGESVVLSTVFKSRVSGLFGDLLA